MFNQYIFEKQLRQKTLGKINNEKIVKMKKKHLKKWKNYQKNIMKKLIILCLI